MQKKVSGVLCLHKEAGMTSHDAVNKIRRLFNTKQVGHTGTLDPMATGVLPILVGRAVKASEYLLCEDKSYIATLQLGITSDTEDIWGTILEKSENLPKKEEVFAVCERFLGEIEQVPPMYSALKVNGRKLCDLARENVQVERQARKIYVHRLQVREIDEAKGLYSLNVTVSKGTYIRTLCADIGKALSCGGVMAGLCRGRSGSFALENSYTLGQLEGYSMEERQECLMPVELLFFDLPTVTLPAFYGKLCSAGCPIYLKKINCDFPIGQRLRLYRNGVFFALGEVQETPEGPAIKALKQFVLFDDGKKET